jgi:class 3 adenylate cyclase
VLISQETYNLVQHAIDAEPTEPRKAKSGDDLPPMYRVIGLR